MLEGIDLSMFPGLRERVKEASTTSPTRSYECPLCRDLEMIELPDRSFTPCRCQAVKRARKLIEKFGKERLEKNTFDTFRAVEPWQKAARDSILGWLKATLNGDSSSLFVGGASGSGKTHLCIAACGELLNAGHVVYVITWREEYHRMTANANDAEEYDRIMYPLKTVPMLYIDDLFKTQREREQTNWRGEKYKLGVQELVSASEVRRFFELLDARYRHNLTTIISCEWTMDELLQIDEGEFSRVYEMCFQNIVEIGRKEGRNMRLKGGVA